MMMDDKQKKLAARKLCELRGIDPNMSQMANDHPYAVYPAWKNALLEIKERISSLQVDEAIKFGMEYSD